MRLIALLLLLVSASARVVVGQQAQWVEFAASDLSFHVSIPHLPKIEPVSASNDKVNLSGDWYSSGNAWSSYAVWSLVDQKRNIGWGEESYLDIAAELFWQELLRPARENRAQAITYTKDLPANPLPGREYSVVLGEISGTAYVFVARHRVFILLAANIVNMTSERERFLSSFKVSPDIKPIPEYGDPKGTDVNDDGPVFRHEEVVQRARVLEKPEPGYTENARTFGVRGAVILRAVFSRTGKVTRIEIVKRLPHGMTDRCLRAARAIKFTPAIKDGAPVSTWMQLEYNFNLF